MHITSNNSWKENHGKINLCTKNGTREFKPNYSGSDELRKGMNVEPRHSLSRTRMLCMSLMYIKTQSDLEYSLRI
jgi:hypothetical protein